MIKKPENLEDILHLQAILDKSIHSARPNGYTTDDILNCYWEKWQKNMSRIGKEWN